MTIQLHLLGQFARTVRSGSILACAVLAGGCVDSAPQSNPAASDSKVSSICVGVMRFEATGQYYYRCREYLKTHAQGDAVAMSGKSEPAEHQACHQIGLKDGTADYNSCVETMYQYDAGARHL